MTDTLRAADWNNLLIGEQGSVFMDTSLLRKYLSEDPGCPVTSAAAAVATRSSRRRRGRRTRCQHTSKGSAAQAQLSTNT